MRARAREESLGVYVYERLVLCLGGGPVGGGSRDFYSPTLARLKKCQHAKTVKYSPGVSNTFVHFKTIFRQCLNVGVSGRVRLRREGEERGGGVGEGQTKRQIVGSLDMSSSLHQTKEI